MTAFWESIDVFSKIFFCIGLASSVALVVQLIFLIVGFAGGAMGDVDGFDSADGGDDSGTGTEMGLFTVKGVLAFFAIGGWVGLATRISNWHIALVLFLSAAAGAAGLFGVGFLYRSLYKLQSAGNINLGAAIGKTAEVYLKIPAGGMGKVTMTLQDRFIELNARSTAKEEIKTGEIVKVVDKIDGILIVTPFSGE